jgi:glycosyltransferase involved in cell wall biosynthesis
MFQNVAPFTRDVVEAYDESGEHRIARRLKLLRRLGIISAHRARRVVFISRAQEATILPQLNIAPDRASVIYTGWDKRFTPEAKSSAAPFLRRHGIGPRYLLSVSHMYRYKNLVELVRGYSIAAKGLPDDVQLVLVGAEPEANYATAVRRAVDESGLAGRVRILGHVPSDDLPPLYAAASMFLFPSTCESFPNILLEALASGAPTLTSNMCSMPEIATNGADYFDPRSPDELASRILSLWNAPTRRTALALAGVARAQQFSWNRMAEELLLLLRNESRALGRSR